MKTKRFAVLASVLIPAGGLWMLLFLVASAHSQDTGPGLPPAAVTTESSPVWASECIDCPKKIQELNDRSLRLDSQGHPHAAYGGDHLYYAWHDGDQWHYQTVDGGREVGASASLALDDRSFAHISYYDATNGDLKYAYQDSSGWHIQTLDWDGDAGSYSSLALGSDSRPRIAYYDATRGDLKFASLGASGWQTQILDSLGDVGRFVSLAIDVDGYALISYTDLTNTDLKFAFQDSTGWHFHTIDSSEMAGFDTSLALDSNGYAHISYLKNNPYFDLMYAYQDGSGWHIQTVDDSSDNTGWGSSLVLDQANKVRISYRTWYGEVRCAVQGSSGWEIQAVDSIGGYALQTSLSVGPSGMAQILYFDRGKGELRLAGAAPAGWAKAVVDRAEVTGASTSLALDESGDPHISYINRSTGALRHARFDSAGWQFESVHTQAGEYTSIALDGEGNPHISSGGNYAYRDHTGWQVQPLADCETTFDSLAIDRDGNAHLACSIVKLIQLPNSIYYIREMNYLSHGPTGWQTQTIMQSSDKFSIDNYRSISLALDGSGHPHASYYLEHSLPPGPVYGSLGYVNQDASGWHSSILDASSDFTGQFTSLALDAGGSPHISYYDITSKDLKYTYRGPSGWYTETVDSQGDVGQYTSLALDAAGNPHISYYDADNGDLKYAGYYDTGWHVQVVDSDGDVGRFSSIAINKAGSISISYTDATQGGLKYAYTPVAISGLSVENDSPTTLNGITTLKASILTGNHVTYTWYFGDGEQGNGAIVTHTYHYPGTYTATVTARNALGEVEASTVVTVAGSRVYFPLLFRR